MVRKNEKVARRARIAYEKWYERFKHNIDQYHLMHQFVLGQQWTDDEEDDMIKTYRKTPLAANKLATMANSLLGEQQQNTPQLETVPMSGCDEEVAHLRDIITKDIMFSTDANIAYQVSGSQAAIGGFGAYGIGTAYTHSKSFDQDIVFFHFKDATRCYWDVGAESINKTDGTLCGYLIRMTRAKFRQVYGKEAEQNIIKTTSISATKEEIALAVQPSESDTPFTWADDESITIINHFESEMAKEMLYKLSNGNILNQEEMDELVEYSRDMNARQEEASLLQELMGNEMPVEGMPQSPDGFGITGEHDILPDDKGLEAVKYNKPKKELEVVEIETPETMTLWQDGEIVRIEEKRMRDDKHIITHYQIAGDYELDKTEFPSETLPLIFVDNNSYYDKACKQVCRSFFGDCKDTQRYINYLRTQSAYVLKVSRYDQWIGSKKNVASLDTQRNWRDPTAIQGMLTYDESPSGAKPEQIMPPELSQSLFQQYQLAIEDLYTSTGLYPARMGNNGDEASGKAIDARTRQGSYTTYVFFNSINRAIAAGGKVVNEMIPRVYDSERVLTLMMPDEGIKNITINKQVDDYGEKIENDIRKGTYQVRLKPGPSYEGQKEQALLSLREVLQADPSAFNLIADLYADNLPLSNTLEIKNRLKTRVPPQIIQAGKTGEMPQQQGPSPEQEALAVEAQFKQAQIQIKQAELQLKEKEMQAEIEIERMKLEIAQIELAGNIENERMRYLAETERTESDRAISHADNMVKILTHKVV